MDIRGRGESFEGELSGRRPWMRTIHFSGGEIGWSGRGEVKDRVQFLWCNGPGSHCGSRTGYDRSLRRVRVRVLRERTQIGGSLRWRGRLLSVNGRGNVFSNTEHSTGKSGPFTYERKFENEDRLNGWVDTRVCYETPILVYTYILKSHHHRNTYRQRDRSELLSQNSTRRNVRIRLVSQPSISHLHDPSTHLPDSRDVTGPYRRLDK